MDAVKEVKAVLEPVIDKRLTRIFRNMAKAIPAREIKKRSKRLQRKIDALPPNQKMIALVMMYVMTGKCKITDDLKLVWL